MKNLLIFFLFLLFMIGVFADTNGPNSVSVMEGDSVTLNSGLIAIQSKDVIEWRFGENRIAKISSMSSMISVWISPAEAFLNRLQLNNQTGDLKITNIKTTNSGPYTLKIRRSSGSSDMTFIVDVSADAVKPVSVMVGDLVTLRTGLTEIQRDKFSIQWMFGDTLIAEIPKKQKQFNESDGKFSGRLDLDQQTGSLNITNIRTTDSGDYKLEISSSRFTINRRINVTVTGSDHKPAASGSGVATGIGVGVGVCVLLVAVYCWWSKRGKPTRSVEYKTETQTLNGTQDSNDPANEKNKLANDHLENNSSL